MTALLHKTGALAAGLFIALAGQVAGAVPLVPGRDDEVVDVLPAMSGSRIEARIQRKRLAARPDDPRLAVAMAKRYLSEARTSGDPRPAGLALALLRPWPDAATAPADVMLMRADLQQYLHEFDASVATLRALLARPALPPQPRAWLVLATVLRVQGRYAESDQACRSVGDAGSALYSRACLAENAALRGDVAAARASFEAMLASPSLPDATLAWLTTSLAELEERDGRRAKADELYRRVLQWGPDAYAETAYADFLIANNRSSEALKVLRDAVRTDAVVLRLAIAGTLAKTAAGAQDAAEMRERIALADERPDARIFHGREQAMFALFVEHQPERALELARGDVAQQREPLDILVYAEAAKASGRADAIADVRRLQREIGLHDRRIDGAL